jgi:hypothetical protein
VAAGPLVIVGGLGTTRPNGDVEKDPSLPVTSMTNPKLPDAVGVPLSNPMLLNPSPPGKVPETIAQEYGGSPPLAASI